MFQRTLLTYILVFLCSPVFSQNEWQSFDQAMKNFMKDTQCANAVISFCAVDVKSGKVLYEFLPNKKLSPASTLKTFTTAAALEYLKPDYTYSTRIIFHGTIRDSVAYGELVISGNGDPSLGSDRFPETNAEKVFGKIDRSLKDHGIRELHGEIIFRDTIPHDSSCSIFWVEEDYGNYYGAGVYEFNWKENKYDIVLFPTTTSFIVTENNGGMNNEKDFCMQLIQKEGSGTEDAFAYIAHGDTCRYALKGFLTASKGKQILSLASLNPQRFFVHDFKNYFGIRFHEEEILTTKNMTEINLLQLSSPPLKELVYVSNQKSLNLYAETFCKSLGYLKFGSRSWEKGLQVMSTFASSLKIDHRKIRLKDGSGLSPQDTITTRIMASLLQHYPLKPWWPDFFKSLPVINHISMKSGYIGGTRSYAGYMTLSTGREIAFAFIVHAYTGSPKLVKEKMFKLLDTLKL